MFLIYNYYVIECVLIPTFYSYYLLTMTTLLPLNIVFLILLLVDIVLKVMMKPKPEAVNKQYALKGGNKTVSRFMLKHYLLS